MRVKMKHLIYTLIFFLVLVTNVQSVQAANTQNVTGMCEYDKAYEVLDIVNKKRKANGQDKLVMDKELLEAAMMRAAEITVLFSHDRPNGQSWSSVSDKVYGENIAYGYGTAKHVMTGWMNSPGHKANILNGDYQSVGIGVFYKDGIRYWVQCFGFAETKTISEPSNVKRTYQVSLTRGKETTIVGANPLSTKVQNFKATVGKKKLTLKWKKKSGIDGYQLQISTNKNYSNKETYKLGKGKTSKTITKYNGKRLKAKKRYYVRIRAYKKVTNTDGTVTKQYSKWKNISRKTR